MSRVLALLHWPQPLVEYLGFLALFFAAGAIGFRFVVFPHLRSLSVAPESHGAIADRAARRAAIIGLLGALGSLVLLANGLPLLAARRHLTVGALLTRDLPTKIQLGLALMAIGGFALALARRSSGWVLAAIGLIVGNLRFALFAQWTRLVNPIHMLAGGMWIGTLFVMISAGFSSVFRSELAPDRRGAAAAAMVNAFSPFALGSAATLATFGVITAWRHLKRLDALWTTPYGYALIVKICLVLIVVALGAWNWRRQRPRLGGEDAAIALRHSAHAELIGAAFVLAATAILVSLPSPR